MKNIFPIIVFCSFVFFQGAAQILLADESPNPAQNITGLLGKDRAVAVFFLGQDCPVANRSLPLVKEWNETLKKRGASVVGVYSEGGITPASIALHSQTYAVDFPVWHDENGKFAASLGVSRLATVVILDASGSLRYRGHFDSSFAKDAPATIRNPTAIRAMDEILDGRAVTTPETEVASCTLDGTKSDAKVPIGKLVLKVKTVPNYHRDIAPLLAKRCVQCHQADGVAPFRLDGFPQAKKRATDMLEEIEARRMPPWHAAPGKLKFSNENYLSDSEILLVKKWVETGAEEGAEIADGVTKPQPAAGQWRQGPPDKVLAFSQPEMIPAAAPATGLPYRYVKLGAPLDTDQWVRGAQIIPGDPSVVHHAIIYIVAPGQKPPMGGEDKISTTDALMVKMMSMEKFGDMIAKDADKEPAMLMAYVPGDDSFSYTSDLGRLIPKGSQLIAEMHYTPSGRPTKDLTRLGLTFHKSKPKHRVQDLIAMSVEIDIPPGKTDHRVRAVSGALPADADLLAFNAHMHFRGKQFRFILRKPDGGKELLLDIPRYDFKWQTTYRLSKPLRVKKGTRIECEAVFDNSSANLTNPDPKARVRFGEQTKDEMMIGSTEFILNP
jgi:mono/diheme cytochrome c family protein/alkyl hydroperoxide reductase subunit AhpC